MKLRYIIASVVAAAAVFAGCQKEEAIYLSDLKVSSSYVALAGEGESNTYKITVESTQPWTLDQMVQIDSTYFDDIKGKTTIKVARHQVNTGVAGDLIVADNTWFTVSPLSGQAGKTEVTFTAPKATENKTSNIKIFVGDNAQNLIVTQSFKAEDPAVVTVDDVLDGTDGTVYRVKGTCSAISSTYYGNFYLKSDTGGSLYIYGCVDATGSYNWSSFNIAVGDKVTVQGSRTTYGSTIEMVDAAFISVEKALILSDVSTKYITETDQTFELPLTVKGSSINFTSAADWLTIEPGYTTDSEGRYVFKVNAAANATGATRNGVLTFKSDNGKSSTIFDLAVEQVGTSAVDGTIKSISDIIKDATSSKNAKSFDINIKDAVVTYKSGSNIFIQDAAGGLCIYDSNCTLKVGDVVSGRVYGKGYAYSNLPEATLFNTSLATVKSGDAPAPVEVKIADLLENYDSYISKYVIIKNVPVYKKIDVNYNKVVSGGAIGDADNNISLNIVYTEKFQDEGAAKSTNRYFYLQVAEGAKADCTGVVGIYKTSKQLNIYNANQVAVLE